MQQSRQLNRRDNLLLSFAIAFPYVYLYHQFHTSFHTTVGYAMSRLYCTVQFVESSLLGTVYHLIHLASSSDVAYCTFIEVLPRSVYLIVGQRRAVTWHANHLQRERERERERERGRGRERERKHRAYWYRVWDGLCGPPDAHDTTRHDTTGSPATL